MNVNMRVAQFTDSEIWAGTESHMLDLARGLRREGVDAFFICPAPSPLAAKAGADGLNVIPLQKGGLLDWRAIRTLRRLLRSGQIHILHAHNGRTALLAAIAIRLARRGRFIATQHFLKPTHVSYRGVKGAFYRLAHHWVNRGASHHLASSGAIRREMLARGDAPSHQITFVPLGIQAPDPDTLTPPDQVRQELGVDGQTPLLICVARLEAEKNLDVLVDAMRLVVAAHPQATCLLAGEGALKNELLDHIRQAGLEDRVRLLGFRTDVPSLIGASDLLVLPSHAEPFGLVLLEAMALGKPVVATRAGGPVEIVVEGQTGLLVPPTQPESLARAILHLLSHPESGREMGRQGRERFHSVYTTERMSKVVLNVYEQVLRRQPETMRTSHGPLNSARPHAATGTNL
jgi:glycosyltransferase involved in cell wall biosynthesis